MDDTLKVAERSPAGFDPEKVRQITDTLNPVAATLFELFEQFMKHQWYTRGPEYKELSDCFEGWADHALEHADAVSERVVDVGGLPLDPPTMLEKAVFKFEAPGIPGMREMLGHDQAAEWALFDKLRKDIPFLDSIGDFGSSILLRNILKEHEHINKKVTLYLAKAGLTIELLSK